MTQALATTTQIAYDAQVKGAYQKSSILRPYVRVRTGIVGTTATFRRYVRGVASPRITQTDVVPMGTTAANATATLAKWHAADYIDRQDQQGVNFQESSIVTENVGAALGRRADQIIIDAIDAAKASADIASGGTGMTFAKLAQLRKLFVAAGIPEDRRNLLIEADGEEDLINDAKFTSSDYVDKRVIEMGKLPPKLLGFNIHVLDDARDEGGLPLVDSDTQSAFAWDSMAVGLAIAGEDDPISTDWVPEKNSWLIAQFMNMGAVVIDSAGVFQVDYDF